MKKYLMTGVAAIAFVAAFTSCSKSNDVYDQAAVDERKQQQEQQKQEQIKEQEYANYAAAFEKAYGKVASTVDWGFGSASAGTRGNAATAETNSEHWARYDAGYTEQYNWDVPAPLTGPQKDKVRRYFQQNQKPGGTTAEAMSNYFVQHVYTGGSNLTDSRTTEKYWSGNWKWVTSSSHMDRLVVGSMHYHVNNFNATNATTLNVWDGVSYQDGYTPSSTESMNVEDFNHKKTHTDQIILMLNVDTQSFGWYQSDASLEINDHYRLVSGDDIQRWDNTTSVNGESADVSGMMFVGFDYEGDPTKVERKLDNGKYIWDGNLNMSGFREATDQEIAEGKAAYIKNHTGENDSQYINLCADGYFSDWIVRITKAVKKVPETPTYRVIAEDLNAEEKTDFDFNDVVFDVEPNEAGTAAKIILQAAGGIYPLTVNNEEVHLAFGENPNEKGEYPMINTSNGTLSKAPVVLFEALAGDYSTDAKIRATIKNIEIKVTKPTGTFVLGATTGEPACKILVDTSFDIVPEKKDISNQYKKFTSYVTGEFQDDFWWK